MKNLRSNLAAKFTAVIFFAINVPVFIISTSIITFNAGYELYTKPYNNDFASELPDEICLWTYNSRNAAIAFLAISTLCLLFTFIFLCCAAGHRTGRDGIILNLADKIPLDIYLTGIFLLITLIIGGCKEELSYSLDVSVVSIILMIICITIATLLALALFLSIATRVKTGTWWRNTLIYIIINLLFRGLLKSIHFIASSFNSIRIVWRSVLIFCFSALVDILLSFWFCLSYGSFMVFILLVAYNTLLLAGVITISNNLRALKKAGEQLASGNLEYKAPVASMYWDFKQHAENLNSLGDGMNLAVEQRLKSERMKTELITNVSHDLKTPLTSLINYVDLLKKTELHGDAIEYVDVLDRQSKRLKKLTEDLIEASKASTGNIKPVLARTGIIELINQVLGEYEEKFEAAQLSPVIRLPDAEIYIMVDGKLIWRIIDNLMSNIAKYAQPGTRVYIDAGAHGDRITIIFRNISHDQLGIEPNELFERFVRGDSSRTTEGSGLGLNIAKSLTELQGGKLDLSIEGDLFRAVLTFPRIQ